MTDHAAGTRRLRLSRGALAAAAVALIAGGALGLLVNVASPNPVYGWQLIIDLLVIVIVLVVAVVPPLRPALPVAVGLTVGVIAGVAIGMNLVQSPNPFASGSLRVQLGSPEELAGTTDADCRVADGKLVELMSPDDGSVRLSDGRRVAVLIGPGALEPVATDRPLDVVVVIGSTLPDGSPTSTRMASDATSTVSISDTGATGSMSFDGLVLAYDSEQREPIDVAGTVTWDCTP
jgi:hypothetical protein